MIALREREEHDKISKMGEIVILLVKASLNDAGLISRKNENIFLAKDCFFDYSFDGCCLWTWTKDICCCIDRVHS